MRRLLALATLAALTAAFPAQAHDGVDHGSAAETAAHAAGMAGAPPPPGMPFPVDFGGAFTLTDHRGQPRTEADPDGNLQLLFFGYANCPSICSVALPLMAEVTDRLRAEGIPATPVMVTVDPARDTVEAIGPPLGKIHPAFVGLTGTEAELSPVNALFGVEKTVVFEDPEHGEIFAHGSHIYLLDGDGAFLTLLPPILSAERITEIVVGYAGS